ncbi:MAG: hypothetical protein JSS02_19500 [Planctomycetes bacterium]|nr:hypothetical protein [Planctomycetota bacterium]
MAKKKASKKSVPPKASKARKPVAKAEPKVADQVPAVTPEQEKAARKHFIQGLVARGEAVPEGQPLPPGATHEIIGTDAEGQPLVKRKRFSLF